jgi:hypothetical protein
MYVVHFTKWESARIAGHEQLLVDSWLEAVADDTSPVSWPPLYSTLQLLRNLLAILPDVDRDVLGGYHVADMVEEILDRLETETWLDVRYHLETVFLKEKLRGVRDRTKDTADDVQVRQHFASLLRSFLLKIDRDDPVRLQRGYLCDKAADRTTSFQVVRRAVAEYTNDLIHLGYSRTHLHESCLRTTVEASDTRTYLEVIRGSDGVRPDRFQAFEVIFTVASPAQVKSTDSINFCSEIPAGWALDPGSDFLRDRQSKIAIVTVGAARDHFAAINQARAQVGRYLASTRWHFLQFDRSISAYAAAREVTLDSPASSAEMGVDAPAAGAPAVIEERAPRELTNHTIRNDRAFYSIPGKGSYNEATFAELDRVLFWLEQSRQTKDLGRLIAEWTALEFLCTLPGKNDLNSILSVVPAYVVPSYCRWLLLDFWNHLLHVRIEFSGELKLRLGITKEAKPGARRDVDLFALHALCLEGDELSNPLRHLISDYSFLIAKWYRVRRMNAGKRSAADDIAVFHRQMEFDLKACYRARNTIVHDAAVNIAQVDRVAQRLNWMLCMCLDRVLFQFSRNPHMTLIDLHRCHTESYDKWRKDLKDTTNPPALETILSPKVYFLA